MSSLCRKLGIFLVDLSFVWSMVLEGLGFYRNPSELQMVYFWAYLDLISSFYIVCQTKCSLASTVLVSAFVFFCFFFCFGPVSKALFSGVCVDGVLSLFCRDLSFLFCLFRIEFFFVSVFLNIVRSNSIILSSPDLSFRMSLRDSISAPI